MGPSLVRGRVAGGGTEAAASGQHQLTGVAGWSTGSRATTRAVQQSKLPPGERRPPQAHPRRPRRQGQLCEGSGLCKVPAPAAHGGGVPLAPRGERPGPVSAAEGPRGPGAGALHACDSSAPSVVVLLCPWSPSGRPGSRGGRRTLPWPALPSEPQSAAGRAEAAGGSPCLSVFLSRLRLGNRISVFPKSTACDFSQF